MSTLLGKIATTKDPGMHVVHSFKRHPLSEPFWRSFSRFKHCSHAFLLDSSLSTSKCGQHSFIGAQPIAVFQASRIYPQSLPFDSAIQIHRLNSAQIQNPDEGAQIEQFRGDALQAIRELLSEFPVSFNEEARKKFPFLGGAVGFFGYEAGSWTGPDGTIKRPSDSNIPDIYFALYDRVLCHDHASGETYLSVIGRGKTRKSACEAIDEATLEIQEALKTTKRVFKNKKPIAEKNNQLPTESVSDKQECYFDKNSYCDAVKTIRKHIEAGDIYQACMTQRFRAALGKFEAWEIYSSLRTDNPAPFACYLHAPSFCVVSASPERYLAVDRSGWAESRPIKGTRPRGKTPHQDAELRKELSDSEKDRAENVMIVDLVRNDFGRVCQFGSIDVSQLMQIETYATVFQMVSTVRGQLLSDRDALDLVRATFPGGSMTGAPKIEAMKILDHLEPVRRGIYSGGIGYLDYAGAMDLNMVIRSVIIEEDTISYHAGGGVVADSLPEAEYQESLDKVVALQRAMEASRHESP